MEQQNQAQTKKQPTRNVATKLWVYFEDDASNKGLVSFDFMPDFDKWLATTGLKPLTIIRGVEKKFRSKMKVTLT